ncbi:MAG: hypothetical protein Q4B68_06415 [Bacteroidales bacterium]|nr:hypothetical protein [Bacteroidales bacterium]
MKIVHNPFLPFRGYKAVNVLGVMLVRRGMEVTEVDIRHERIHTRQMLELGILPFYVLYVLEWLVRLPMRGNAYRSISFEREAYAHERDKHYLQQRPLYAWRHYLRKHKNTSYT